MLVLGRRVNESIVIDDRISITVLSSERGKVRLGITAPDDIAIQRAEICHRRDTVSPLRGERDLPQASAEQLPLASPYE